MSEHVQQNSAFYLSLATLLCSCVAGLTAYLLKSRCSTIRVCGCIECIRDPLPADAVIDVEARAA